MNVSTTRIAVIALVLMVATAGVGAAAVGWDTETTNTTTTSDADGSTTSITAYHGDATNSTWFEATVDNSANNYTLELRTNDELGYVMYQNSSHDVTDATNNHIAFNVTHDEIADVPRDVDGTSVEAVIYNDSDPTDNVTSTFTLDTGNANPTAVMHLTDGAGDPDAAADNLLADTAEYDESFGFLSYRSIWSDNGTDVASFSGWTTINGTETDVEIHMKNSTAASAYGEQVSGASDGEWIEKSTLYLNGKPVQVYAGSAPDDVGSSEDYAVYNNDTEVLEITLQSEELSDVTTLYVRGGAGESYGFWTAGEHFGYQTASALLNPA